MNRTVAQTRSPGERVHAWAQARALAWRWLPALLLAGAVAVAYGFGLNRFFSLATILREHESLERWFLASRGLFVLAFVAVYIAVVSLSIPGAALCTLCGGYIFGWFGGGLLSVIAATIGAGILFTIAQTSLGTALRDRAGPHVQRFAAGFRDNALSYMLFLRLVPLFPFWLVNIAPALIGVRLSVFMLGTFVGIIPGTFTYAFVGAGLDSLLEAQEAANPGCTRAGSCDLRLSALVTDKMVFALIALGLLSLVPVALKTLRRAH